MPLTRLLFFGISLLLLAACTPEAPPAPPPAPVEDAAEKPEGDPCHLPYLDGGDHFVAAIDVRGGGGKPLEKKWSAGSDAGAIDVKAPIDGFPGHGKMRAVLILIAHKPVEWRIDPLLARQTDAVLTAGFDDQKVVGLSAETPVAHASHERAGKNQPSCVAMEPFFAENKDATRFFTINTTMDTLTSLNIDRYYENHRGEPASVAIPPTADPHQIKR